MPNNSEHPRIVPPSGLPIYYRGPKLELGPLPCLFYFALSGEESLYLDPFNQPAAFLSKKPIRVFSSTLPSHGAGQKNSDAMLRWSEEFRKRTDILSEFLDQCCDNLGFLISQGYIDESRVAAAGLSRGGFIATHFAARDPRISHVLGYAPMTSLSTIAEFKDILEHPIAQSWDLARRIPQLINKKVRYYIGNLDTRVGTKECFDFVYQLTQAAHENKVRSPTVEMIISPSIGHKGHGTPPHIFKAGADWIAKEFL